MSASAMVISSDEITLQDLAGFVNSIGGILVPQEKENFVVSDKEADLWLGIQDPAFAASFYDEETIDAWEKALESKPKSIIELQLDHSDKCRQLYLFVAYKLGEKWNVILDDIDDKIISFSELNKRYMSNNDKLTIDK